MSQKDEEGSSMEMNVRQLHECLQQKKDLLLLDVREPGEYEIANIGGKLIPLGDLPMRFHELDPEKETVVMCHHGGRSAQACLFLQSRGFKRVKNLSGGIDQWSTEVDPTIMRY